MIKRHLLGSGSGTGRCFFCILSSALGHGTHGTAQKAMKMVQGRDIMRITRIMMNECGHQEMEETKKKRLYRLWGAGLAMTLVLAGCQGKTGSDAEY